MPFPYTSIQIGEIVKAAKIVRHPEMLREGVPLPFKDYGSKGKRLDLLLDLVDGPLTNLRFHVRSGVFDNPETFEAALILENQRVRGVGWNATGKKQFYGRQRIPRGWHQNVLDPNLPDPRESDPHPPLENFDPTDLSAFFVATAKLWHIDRTFSEGLL